jgi:enediyne biosynthesis protein E4
MRQQGDKLMTRKAGRECDGSRGNHGAGAARQTVDSAYEERGFEHANSADAPAEERAHGRTLRVSLDLPVFALLLGVLLWPPALSRAQTCFTESAQFGSKATIAVAWADCDGDGDPDLAVGNNSRGNQLFINNGNGTFTEQAQFGTGSTFAVVWADFDNDGDPDMAVGRSNLASYLYLNNGNGTFTQQSVLATHNTIALAWADFNRDGRLDLAAGNGLLGFPEQNTLYVNNGDGTFTPQAQFGQGQTATVAWGDFNNDGWPDLAAGNGGFGYTGQNYLYVNNGNGTFTERAEFGQGDTSCLDWADFNNDGWLDLAVGNWNNGQCYLYVNDGHGNFTEEPVFGVHNVNGIATGDFNNDGWLDLALADGTFSAAEQNYLYINNGDGTFTELPAFGLGSTDAVAWADVDLDGDLDLAVGNEHTPGQNYLETNCQEPGPYLEVRLLGHRHDLGPGCSNRDGIGAKIAVYEAGFLGDAAHLLGYREVSAHGGFASQNLRDAHFGLPGQTSVDLRVTWPGSYGFAAVQDLPAVAVNQSLLVEEPVPPASVPPASPQGSSGRLQVSPNPAVGSTTLEWSGADPSLDRMQIYDAGGQLVRTLRARVEERSATRRAQWDGKGEAGDRLPAGLYFVRPPGADMRAAGRVLLLP